ncbi:MAG: hypothetical protein ABJA76_17055, partial [Mucilaginibacter sp.]
TLVLTTSPCAGIFPFHQPHPTILLSRNKTHQIRSFLLAMVHLYPSASTLNDKSLFAESGWAFII